MYYGFVKTVEEGRRRLSRTSSIVLSVCRTGSMNGFKTSLFFCLLFEAFCNAENENTQRDNINDSPLPFNHGKSNRIRQRFMGRRTQPRGPLLQKKEICYDMIGCFELPRKHSLKKPPQSPDWINTKFWIYTRATTNSLEHKYEELLVLRDDAQLVQYGDGLESLKKSSFDPKKHMKVLIHGFKGSGTDKGALSGVQEFLKLGDWNVLVVDWERGAAHSYATAAANTEIIGRQTAVMLLDMITMGLSAKNIHVIGFSLGAHIAGCAGEMVKQKDHKLARITGLDPASPLFKNALLREASTKLDATKADFVDVIHTDGSPVFTDGFGLLSPIGHVDFFPNGGREQPGCSDGRGSVVVSHIEGTINSSIACSHVRAWQLFLESAISLQDPTGCQFTAFPCQGGNDRFVQGRCFVEPKERCMQGDRECNIMGMGAYENGARGAVYLATRDSPPFCGEQLQASVEIAQETGSTRGYLHMRLRHGDHFTNFKLSHELADHIQGGTTLNALAVAEGDTISGPKTPSMDALLSFQSLEFQTSKPNADTPSTMLATNNIYINDSRGNKWYHCGNNQPLQYINGTTFGTLVVKLTLDPC